MTFSFNYLRFGANLIGNKFSSEVFHPARGFKFNLLWQPRKLCSNWRSSHLETCTNFREPIDSVLVGVKSTILEYKKSSGGSRNEFCGICVTYVERLLQHNPPRLGLDLEVLQVVGVVGRAKSVHDGSIVIGVLVRGRHAEDVRSDAGILLDILDVFLARNEKKN